MHRLYTYFYGGDSAQKIRRAVDLFERYGPTLQKSPPIMAGLETLLGRHRTLMQQMLDMHMDRICARCAQNSEGGCCSSGFAEETDVPQLLMNLLAGVQLALRPGRGVACRYLGKQGCIFLFKPMFCLNYNCRQITGQGDPSRLTRLAKRTGELLRNQQELEARLLEYFTGRSTELLSCQG